MAMNSVDRFMVLMFVLMMNLFGLYPYKEMGNWNKK